MQYKFNVGDKVRVCNVLSSSNKAKKKHIGEIFTIREIMPHWSKECPYAVEESSCIFVWSEKELELVTEHATNEKIVITVDGRTTLARLYKDGKVVKSAEARCCPEDTFDFATGANLAYNRLMGVPTGEEKKEEPKPKYYSGKVVCVKAHIESEFFKVGKIYEFKDGKVIDNHGNERPMIHRATALDDEYMKSWCYQFIPLVEE